MMKSFRKLTNNLAFKVVLGIVALSFIFFGVSSFILGGSTSWVAKIGSKKISYSTLQKAMKENREMIINSYGNNEQALAYLDSEQFTSDSLGRIINQQMVKNLSHEFNITASKKVVLENIAKDKNFSDATGKFSQEKFKEFLKRNGINEDLYVNEIINQVSMMMILQTMEIAAPVSSKKIIDVIEFNDEKRVVDLISLNEKDVKNIANVTQNEIEKYYADNKKQFTLPEIRRISYVKINAKDLAQSIEIKDEEIASDYEKNKNLYQLPETRDFYHIVFDKEQSAKDFAEKLKKTSKDKLKDEFANLAKELQKKNLKEITLSNTGKKQLLPQTIEPAFNLAVNEISQPVKSQLGFHIFLLNAINKSATKSLAEVREEIKQKLLEGKQNGAFEKKIVELDSALIASNSLSDSLIKNKINTTILKANIDDTGKDEGGREIFGEDAKEIAKNSFALKKGQASKLFNSPAKDSYYAIQLDEIVASKTEELTKVSRMISTKLQSDKKQEALIAYAQEVADEVGENLDNPAKIATKHKLKFEKNRIMPRTFVINYQGQQFPYRSPLLEKIFTIDVNKSSGAISEAGGYAVAILREVKKPLISKDIVEQVAKSSQQMFRSDIMQQFNNYLLKKYPVEVNEKIFRQKEKN